MEKYKATLKQKLMGNVTMSISMVTILLVTRFINTPIFKISSITRGFSSGIAVAIILLTTLNVIKIKKALNDPKKTEQLYVKEHDERTNYIKTKVFSFAFIVAIALLIIATIIAGNFNEIVFYTLVSVLLICLIIALICKIIFKIKY